MSYQPPPISIITPVYNTDPLVLEETIQSVLAQTYPDWELCICDDKSTSVATIEVLEKYQGTDSRIKIVRSGENLHISRASNRAIELAVGDFVGFLDHDDTLVPTAIEEVVRAIEADPTIDVLYSDEDKIDFDGSYCDPYYKPGWSPEHLHSVMYVLHFFVVRRNLFWKLGGLRDKYTGAQDFDLMLRASRRARKIHHIPEILYHWRKVEGSASAEVDAKPYALDNGQAALADFVANSPQGGRVEAGLLPGFFRVRYNVPESASATILILTKETTCDINGEKVVLLHQALKSIRDKTTFKNFETLVVHRGELSPTSRRLLADVNGRDLLFPGDGPFNYSARINFGAANSKSEFLIMLNDDTEIVTPDWIESLLEWLQVPEVGAVGGRLLYPNNTVQHAGMALIPHWGSTHPFYGLEAQAIGYNGFTHLVRNYTAVTGALLATPIKLFNKVGGFDELLSTDFNDTDFCLRLYQHGYRIVYTPHCEVVHYENSSLHRTEQNRKEVELFTTRWNELLIRDPYIDVYKIKDLYPHAIDPRSTIPGKHSSAGHP